MEVLDAIRANKLDPRKLTLPERLPLVAYLKNEGFNHWEIAHLLKVSDRTIDRDSKTLFRNRAHLVQDLSIERVAGNLIAEAQHIIAKAKKMKKYELAWQILRELIEQLQSMGFVLSVPKQLDIRHSVDGNGTGPEQGDPYENLLNRIKNRLTPASQNGSNGTGT